MMMLGWLAFVGCGSPEPCAGEDPQPRMLRRLTPVEYDRTMSDLLGIDATGVAPRLGDPSVDGFGNDARALVVDPTLADHYRDRAEYLSKRVDVSAMLPCNPDQTGEEACAAQFIIAFGTRAFRRPVTREEMGRYLTLWRQVAERDGFTQAIRWVTAGMLQSPHLLYRSELGVRVGRGTYALTDWEMASALSYTLWGTMPDDVLLEAAQAGELSTSEQVSAHVDRMLADPRAQRVLADFMTDWLDLDRLPTVERADMSTWVRDEMWSDTLALLAERSEGSLSELMTDGGLLTDQTVLTVHARTSGSSPVHRGLLVRERLLCEHVPEPPPNIDLALVEVDADGTTRQQFEQHSSNPVCAECHQQLDPLGVAFEHYDQLGRYRPDERGLPIDASGHLDGIPFDGPEELSALLLEDPRFRTCFSRAWRRFATGMHACGEDVDPSTGVMEPLREILGWRDFRRRTGEANEGDTLAVSPPEGSL